MGSLSIWHWLIVLAVILLLFGGSSKISTLMGDFAKGIKSFKKNMGEDESMEHGTSATPPSTIAAPSLQAAHPAQSTAGYTVYPAQGATGGAAGDQAPVEPVRHPG